MLLGHEVDSARCRHAARETVDALLFEVGDQFCVVGDDGEAVAGRDEGVGAVDHVAVAVAVRGGSELDAVFVDGGHERVGVYEVGVWMSAAEIGGWDAVLGGAAGKAEFLFEDGDTVGARDAIEGVEEDFEIFVG